MIRSTHTYAILPVSSAAYAEIKQKLEVAGYQYAFHDTRPGEDGIVIDMYGIALKNEEERCSPEVSVTPFADRAHIQVLLAQAITARLKEQIVDEVISKPTIAELEIMMTKAEEEGKKIGTLMPNGDIMSSHPKPVFASDLVDAVLSALQSSGFEIVAGKKEPRTVLNAHAMCRPGDEPLA